MNKLPILKPDLQINFFYRLKTIKEKFFIEALSDTVKELEIPEIDKQLANFVEQKYLNKVASFSLRGELFFPIPYIMEANPFLIGYYRLLFGISQKEMYKGQFGKFKRMEVKGEISDRTKPYIEELCKSLICTGQIFVDKLDILSPNTVTEMQLLTLGPQLRGGRNTEVGDLATKETFKLIEKLVTPYILNVDNNEILIENNSKRKILIKFSGDPDIAIIELFSKGDIPLIAIEIKGGKDISNIHNRIGEAEKSHRKAKGDGYSQFWTIIKVDIDYEVLHKESPTTTKFFHLDRIQQSDSAEFEEFTRRLSSLLNIKINDC